MAKATVNRSDPDPSGTRTISVELQGEHKDHTAAVDYTAAVCALVLHIARELHLTPEEVWERVGGYVHELSHAAPGLEHPWRNSDHN